MSRVSAGSRGVGKSKLKGKAEAAYKNSKKVQTTKDFVVRLRKAIYDEDGRDKDVTKVFEFLCSPLYFISILRFTLYFARPKSLRKIAHVTSHDVLVPP